jgi:mxaJ protein
VSFHTLRALCIGAALAAPLIGIGTLPAASAASTVSPLRVCADPDYLPYSNSAGQGFENKIAQVVGRALGRPVVFVYKASRGEADDAYEIYLHQTIDAGKCDLLVNVPYAFTQLHTTKPYYISSYVFIYKKKAGYDLTSLDSPILHHVKIGYEVDTPAEDGLKLRALTIGAKPFMTLDDTSVSPSEIVDAVESGKINVGISWAPAVGYYVAQHPDLVMVTIPNARSQGSPEQYSFPMSMATRNDDPALNAAVNQVISQHGAALQAVLRAYHIQFFEPGASE